MQKHHLISATLEINSRSLSAAQSLGPKGKKKVGKKREKEPPPLCLTLSGSINDQMEAICVTALTAVTGRQLTPPTYCIQKSQERPRKRGRMDGVMESVFICLGGWIRSLERRRIKMRSDAERRLKQGIMEEGRRGAKEEKDGGGDKEGGRLEEEKKRDDPR